MHWSNFYGGGMIMMIAWLILIALAITALVKWIFGSRNGKTNSDSAMDIVRRRYASGEITQEEFDEYKENL